MEQQDKKLTKKEAYIDKYYRTRLEIVRLLESGKTVKETAEILKKSMGYVSRIKKDYEFNGSSALEPYQRGKAWGNEDKDMWDQQ